MGVDQSKLPDGYGPEHDARFRVVEAATLGNEGGYANRPTDRGGETMYGVSSRFLKSIGDPRTVSSLTKADAFELYRVHFWMKPGFWRLPQPLDAALFDEGVNAGPQWATGLLQEALNALYRTSLGLQPLVADGVLGPKTIVRIGSAAGLEEIPEVLGEFRLKACERYRAVVAHDPTQSVNLEGWLARAGRLGDV